MSAQTAADPIGRRATPADLDAITATLSLAFEGDPVWGWAFGGAREIEVCWRLCLHSAIPHGWVWTTAGYEAAALWIPPGRPELSPADDTAMEPALRAVMGARADVPLGAWPDFETYHPQDEPHYYLSLLGTHPDHRGTKRGMRLLSESLAAIDAEHTAAYLESTNPMNNERYASVGFEPSDSFVVRGGTALVTTMWRPAR